MSVPTTILGTDGLPRCRWCAIVPEFEVYHDCEWGFPVADDVRLFEKLCLEGFQSGLSWRTILTKRENFRRAFRNFDFHQLAQFGETQVSQLLLDEGIVRHRGKIEAVINNAKCAVRLHAEYGSLAAYFWQYEARRAATALPQTISIPPQATGLSKDLKKRGWKFIGPTTVYAFMQAMGLVNDHVAACVIAKRVDQAREAFTVPGRTLQSFGRRA
ncbi:DNA-3-methyladenine glycosylase I [Chitiniphilus purpureus]|uniref:DNA-3-methyladenine glycosylase I n=1 Tax=Chitiniphilus purpureus TaxID=2981137 RepID=A0ABY6DR29_9NEIS|nr:DNA-3-methyladenine glycosylase I [Chitiniphilus sp. CD1]UXY16683.1 DNA-3-methyladenine glycosylase I [Chitiniphilus sp. CD1]